MEKKQSDWKDILICIAWACTTIFIIGFICIILSGCTMQKPTSTSIVNNYTITDNSQHIAGNNNTPNLQASTTTDQIVKPDVSTTAKNTQSNSWVLWIILGVSVIGAGIWLSYKKYGKWWLKLFAWVRFLF